MWLCRMAGYEETPVVTMDPSPLRITTCLPTNCNIVRFFPNSLQQKLIKVLCMYINPHILNVLVQCSCFGHQITSVLRFQSPGCIFQRLHVPLFKCNDLQIHLWVLHLLHPTIMFQYKNYNYEDQASGSQYIFKPQGKLKLTEGILLFYTRIVHVWQVWKLYRISVEFLSFVTFQHFC